MKIEEALKLRKEIID